MNRKELRDFVGYCMMKGLFKDDLTFSDYELADQYLKDSDIINFDKLEKDIDNLLKQDLTVYEFCYNDACYACSPLVISIHLTKKGAEMAMAFHKENEKKEHFESYGNSYEFKYDFDKWWGIRETIILK